MIPIAVFQGPLRAKACLFRAYISTGWQVRVGSNEAVPWAAIKCGRGQTISKAGLRMATSRILVGIPGGGSRRVREPPTFGGYSSSDGGMIATGRSSSLCAGFTRVLIMLPVLGLVTVRPVGRISPLGGKLLLSPSAS